MRVVLGLDPAWGERNESGVALLVEHHRGRWECLLAAASYDDFARRCLPSQSPSSPSALCEPPRMLAAATAAAGARPDLVIADIPLATVPILSRRVADNLISKRFGGQGAGTHTPNGLRPGRVGTAISDGFQQEGYPLATASGVVGSTPQLLETYPHPALLVLLERPYRLEYKLSRRRLYWRDASPPERLANIKEVWRSVLRALQGEINHLTLEVPISDAIADLKRFEDTLDALISAWVGTRYLSGQAVAYGDATSAIWVPS